MLNLTLRAQTEAAYEAAFVSAKPDWQAVAKPFRAAMQSEQIRRPKPKGVHGELPDYNVDRSPRIAVRFMDGEAVFTHVPSALGKALNVGRALRVAIAMYRSRKSVQRRAGFRKYNRSIPTRRENLASSDPEGAATKLAAAAKAPQQ